MQETLNAVLRNKVQPLQVYIDALTKLKDEDLKDYQKQAIITMLTKDEYISLLKDLRDYLIG